MAFPTAVNDQVTDAVAQSAVGTLVQAPAMAMAGLYQSMAHSTGLMFANAVAAQQQQGAMCQASMTQAITTLYALDTASSGKADTGL